MTNEQLYFPLKQMVTRLKEAIEAAEEVMPDDAPHITERSHAACQKWLCLNQDHIVTVPTEQYVALGPLYKLAEEWEADVESLACIPALPPDVAVK